MGGVGGCYDEGPLKKVWLNKGKHQVRGINKMTCVIYISNRKEFNGTLEIFANINILKGRKSMHAFYFF